MAGFKHTTHYWGMGAASSLLLFILACSLLPGCQSVVPPAEVLKAFQDKYSNAKKPSWNIDQNGRYEAKFSQDGQQLRADFNPDGAWVETERSITFNDLPDAVKAAIEKEFSKKDIVEIERTDSHEKGVFYDVEFKPKGAEKFDVEFAEDGAVLATKRR